MTINSINYSTIEDLTNEWKGKANKIGFQFHTPFVREDPLWLEFGDVRNQVVDKLIELRKKIPFICNQWRKTIKANERQLGRTGYYTNQLSVLGNTFIRSYGKN
jgi:hypothetical protein